MSIVLILILLFIASMAPSLSQTDIIRFVIGALFGGLLNSGINAAWSVCYLANNDYWMQRVREEIDEVAERHCRDHSLPLKDRLMRVPIEAWETEFPMIDLCLKESIRLQLKGTDFRQNLTNQEIAINKRGEVIPPGAYVAIATADIHYDPNIYPEPERFDPGRYLPDRAEDKKEQYGWMACFSHFENVPIYHRSGSTPLADQTGQPKAEVSRTDLNRHSASKPETHMFLRYQVRQD
ncbi:uncharacterized protein MYCFIDRAFT_85589 [Pseudocercospora fijiensis CIRAD86]|uniref:Cytochrome P450 n=1 Tax=Pseudocercospora fijiensis (strain CIRAD86) TaxID=383855 RepID=M2ZTB4_PSEFD|nr:uncharacterized protein MYCFIDRAFT_85589 [Pseudocercospora fijiensis CIRAD86]EME82249.1 hypothetical protein MYCFIDRAFT_85589 [Pseudocercospora fijiensis CIRAD86]